MRLGLDIDLFTHIYVEVLNNTGKDFKTHRCAIEFDSPSLGLHEKES